MNPKLYKNKKNVHCIAKRYLGTLGAILIMVSTLSAGRENTVKNLVYEDAVTFDKPEKHSDIRDDKNDPELKNKENPLEDDPPTPIGYSINRVGSSNYPTISFGPNGETYVQIIFDNLDTTIFNTTANFARVNQYVQYNFPFPKDDFYGPIENNFVILDPHSVPIPIQAEVSSRWDGPKEDTTKSIKLLRIGHFIDIPQNAEVIYTAKYGQNAGSNPSPPTSVSTNLIGNQLTINTGVAEYTLSPNNFNLFDSISVNGVPIVTMLPSDGVKITDKGVTRIDGAIVPTDTNPNNTHANLPIGGKRIKVPDSSGFDVGQSISFHIIGEITYVGSLNPNATPPQGPYVGLTANTDVLTIKGSSFKVGDVVLISKGTPRQEIKTIASITDAVNPSSWTAPGTFNADKITFTTALQFDHETHDTIELEVPLVDTISQIPNAHEIQITTGFTRSLNRGVMIRPTAPIETTYSTNNSPTMNFTIEENGPLRIRIFAEGTFKSSSGKGDMRWQARLYFFAGQEFCKIEFVRANTKTYGYFDKSDSQYYCPTCNNSDSYGPNNDRYLESNFIRIPFNNSGFNAQVIFDVSEDFNTLAEHTVNLNAGDQVYQFVTMNQPNSDYSVLNPRGDPTVANIFDNFEGAVEKNGNIVYPPSGILAGGNGNPLEYHPYGTAMLTNGSMSLTIGVKDFWHKYPHGIKAEPNALTIDLLGSSNGHKPFGPRKRLPFLDSASVDYYNHQAGVREIREFMLYPSLGQPSFPQIRDEMRGYLQHHVYPTLNDQFERSQILSNYYVQAKDWSEPSLQLDPELAEVFQLKDLWDQIMTDTTAVDQTLPSYLKRTFKEMRDEKGYVYGEHSNYGFDYGVWSWADGRTLHYDHLRAAVVAFLRKGLKEVIPYFESMADASLFYRWYYLDDVNDDKAYSSLLDSYEKSFWNKEYYFPSTSHNWVAGKVSVAAVTDNPWAWDYLKRWTMEYVPQTGTFPGTGWNTGSCSNGPREHGWTGQGIMAAYELIGDPTLLTIARDLYNQYDACDQNQSTGPVGYIHYGNKSQVWMHSIFMSGLGDYLNKDENPPDNLFQFAKRWANWFINATNDPITNPQGRPFLGGGTNNNFTPYESCNEYDRINGCLAPYSQTTASFGAEALSKIYRAFKKHNRTDINEDWAHWAKEIMISNLKFAGTQTYTRNRFDPFTYTPLSARNTQNFSTELKLAYALHNAPNDTMYNELFVRRSCSQLGGEICLDTQICLGSSVSSTNGACCIPMCSADTLSPAVVGIIEPHAPLHNSTNTVNIVFQTNEQALCRFDTTSKGPNLDYTTMNPMNSFMTTDEIHHSFALVNHDGLPLGPSDFPNGVTIPMMISCVDTPHNPPSTPGNVMSPIGFNIMINGPNLTPPTISNTIITPTEDSVTITWSTDELATTQAQVNLPNGSQFQQTQNLNSTTAHTVTFQNLTPSTIYHYIVSSVDSDNNPTSQSGMFITDNAVINITINESNTNNTDMCGINAGANQGSQTYAEPAIGYASSWFLNSRGLIKFDLANANLPLNINNLQIFMRLKVQSVTPPSAVGQPQVLQIYRLSGDAGFSQGNQGNGNNIMGSSNWFYRINNTVAWNIPGGDIDPTFAPVSIPITATVNTNYEMDITGLAESCITQQIPYCNFLIKAPNNQTPIINFNRASTSLIILGESAPEVGNCVPTGVENCNDGIDNDCDTYFDCMDSECESSSSCNFNYQFTVTSQGNTFQAVPGQVIQTTLMANQLGNINIVGGPIDPQMRAVCTYGDYSPTPIIIEGIPFHINETAWFVFDHYLNTMPTQQTYIIPDLIGNTTITSCALLKVINGQTVVWQPLGEIRINITPE